MAAGLDREESPDDEGSQALLTSQASGVSALANAERLLTSTSRLDTAALQQDAPRSPPPAPAPRLCSPLPAPTNMAKSIGPVVNSSSATGTQGDGNVEAAIDTDAGQRRKGTQVMDAVYCASLPQSQNSEEDREDERGAQPSSSTLLSPPACQHWDDTRQAGPNCATVGAGGKDVAPSGDQGQEKSDSVPAGCVEAARPSSHGKCAASGSDTEPDIEEDQAADTAGSETKIDAAEMEVDPVAASVQKLSASNQQAQVAMTPLVQDPVTTAGEVLAFSGVEGPAEKGSRAGKRRDDLSFESPGVAWQLPPPGTSRRRSPVNPPGTCAVVETDKTDDKEDESKATLLLSFRETQGETQEEETEKSNVQYAKPCQASLDKLPLQRLMTPAGRSESPGQAAFALPFSDSWDVRRKTVNKTCPVRAGCVSSAASLRSPSVDHQADNFLMAAEDDNLESQFSMRESQVDGHLDFTAARVKVREFNAQLEVAKKIMPSVSAEGEGEPVVCEGCARECSSVQGGGVREEEQVLREDAAARARDLEALLRKEKERNQSLCDDNDEAEAEVKQLKEQLEQAKKGAKEEKGKLDMQIQQLTEQLEQVEKGAKEDKRKLGEDFKQLRDRLDQAEKDATESKRKQVMAEQNAYHPCPIRDVHASIHVRKDICMHTRLQVCTYIHAHAHTRTRAHTPQVEKEEKESRAVNDLNEEKKKLADMLKASKTELETVQTDYQKALACLREEKEQKESERKSVLTTNTLLMTKINELEVQLVQVRSSLTQAEIRSESSRQEADRLSQRVADLNKSEAESASRNETLRIELKARDDALKEESEAKFTETQALMQQVSALRKDRDDLHAQNETLRIELASSKTGGGSKKAEAEESRDVAVEAVRLCSANFAPASSCPSDRMRQDEDLPDESFTQGQIFYERDEYGKRKAVVAKKQTGALGAVVEADDGKSPAMEEDVEVSMQQGSEDAKSAAQERRPQACSKNAVKKACFKNVIKKKAGPKAGAKSRTVGIDDKDKGLRLDHRQTLISDPEDGDASGWTCLKCTFFNAKNPRKCGVCTTSKSEALKVDGDAMEESALTDRSAKKASPLKRCKAGVFDHLGGAGSEQEQESIVFGTPVRDTRLTSPPSSTLLPSLLEGKDRAVADVSPGTHAALPALLALQAGGAAGGPEQNEQCKSSSIWFNSESQIGADTLAGLRTDPGDRSNDSEEHVDQDSTQYNEAILYKNSEINASKIAPAKAATATGTRTPSRASERIHSDMVHHDSSLLANHVDDAAAKSPGKTKQEKEEKAKTMTRRVYGKEMAASKRSTHKEEQEAQKGMRKEKEVQEMVEHERKHREKRHERKQQEETTNATKAREVAAKKRGEAELEKEAEKPKKAEAKRRSEAQRKAAEEGEKAHLRRGEGRKEVAEQGRKHTQHEGAQKKKDALTKDGQATSNRMDPEPCCPSNSKRKRGAQDKQTAVNAQTPATVELVDKKTFKTQRASVKAVAGRLTLDGGEGGQLTAKRARVSGPGEVGVVGQPKRILFVGFDTGEEEQQKRKLEAWVKKMGTVMDPKRVGAAKECTHIVMPRIKTSSKFLAAIARGGVPVLAPGWIKECERQQRWVDERAFWLKDETDQAKLGIKFDSLKARSMSQNPSPPVFQGLTFVRDPSFGMNEAETKQLIECAGGCMASSIKTAPADVIVLSKESSTSSKLPARKPVTWVKTCILQHNRGR